MDELDDADYLAIHRAWFGEGLTGAVTDEVRAELVQVVGLLEPEALAGASARVLRRAGLAPAALDADTATRLGIVGIEAKAMRKLGREGLTFRGSVNPPGLSGRRMARQVSASCRPRASMAR